MQSSLNWIPSKQSAGQTSPVKPSIGLRSWISCILAVPGYWCESGQCSGFPEPLPPARLRRTNEKFQFSGIRFHSPPQQCWRHKYEAQCRERKVGAMNDECCLLLLLHLKWFLLCQKVCRVFKTFPPSPSAALSMEPVCRTFVTTPSQAEKFEGGS